jgi:hypothetical protein
VPNLCVLCGLVVCQENQPQRYRAHRGCTEKIQIRDYSIWINV